MEQFVEWLMTLDTTAITAAIVGLITTYGGTLIWYAISSMKNKIKKSQFEEALAKNKLENQQELTKQLHDFKTSVIDRITTIQEEIIAKDEASQTARLEAIKSLANNIQTTSVELINNSVTQKDINSILDDLE